MVNGRSVALTALVLLLAGTSILFCNKKPKETFEYYQAVDLNREIDNVCNHFASEGRKNKNKPDELQKLDAARVPSYYVAYDSCLDYLAIGIIKEAQGKKDSAAFFYSQCMNELDKRKSGGFIAENGGASVVAFGPLRFYNENSFDKDSVQKYTQKAKQLENDYTPEKVKEYLKSFN